MESTALHSGVAGSYRGPNAAADGLSVLTTPGSGVRSTEWMGAAALRDGMGIGETDTPTLAGLNAAGTVAAGRVQIGNSVTDWQNFIPRLDNGRVVMSRGDNDAVHVATANTPDGSTGTITGSYVGHVDGNQYGQWVGSAGGYWLSSGAPSLGGSVGLQYDSAGTAKLVQSDGTLGTLNAGAVSLIDGRSITQPGVSDINFDSMHLHTGFGVWVRSTGVDRRTGIDAAAAGQDLELYANYNRQALLNASGFSVFQTDGTTLGTVNAAALALNAFDTITATSAGTTEFASPYANTVKITSGQTGQQAGFELFTAEGKKASIKHYDVANAKGRLLEMTSQPGTPIAFAPGGVDSVSLDPTTGDATFSGTIASDPTGATSATKLIELSRGAIPRFTVTGDGTATVSGVVVSPKVIAGELGGTLNYEINAYDADSHVYVGVESGTTGGAGIAYKNSMGFWTSEIDGAGDWNVKNQSGGTPLKIDEATNEITVVGPVRVNRGGSNPVVSSDTGLLVSKTSAAGTTAQVTVMGGSAGQSVLNMGYLSNEYDKGVRANHANNTLAVRVDGNDTILLDGATELVTFAASIKATTNVSASKYIAAGTATGSPVILQVEQDGARRAFWQLIDSGISGSGTTELTQVSEYGDMVFKAGLAGSEGERFRMLASGGVRAASFIAWDGIESQRLNGDAWQSWDGTDEYFDGARQAAGPLGAMQAMFGGTPVYQPAAIADAPTGGSANAADNAAKINELLAAIRSLSAIAS